MLQFLRKHELKISCVAIVIVFLALIRLIFECWRILPLVSSAGMIFPYYLGALITAISCLIMTILSFYSKSRVIILVAIITIISLVVIKIYFRLP